MKKRFVTICMISVLAIVLVTGMTVFFRSDVSANNESVIQYEQVEIKSGDSLWSIAKEHYKEPCGDIRDYVDQIRKCNNLKSDEITEGYYLCIPVYTNDF
ncbi:MAG: LysM peptidoglycan-binding domain-containing protein [Lachnospiraceae bacterium]|nr:LysM peptidoglycan-binding domain-containing protein [Lachnospiraceae bacterium]